MNNNYFTYFDLYKILHLGDVFIDACSWRLTFNNSLPRLNSVYQPKIVERDGEQSENDVDNFQRTAVDLYHCYGYTKLWHKKEYDSIAFLTSKIHDETNAFKDELV